MSYCSALYAAYSSTYHAAKQVAFYATVITTLFSTNLSALSAAFRATDHAAK